MCAAIMFLVFAMEMTINERFFPHIKNPIVTGLDKNQKNFEAIQYDKLTRYIYICDCIYIGI